MDSLAQWPSDAVRCAAHCAAYRDVVFIAANISICVYIYLEILFLHPHHLVRVVAAVILYAMLENTK